MQSLSLKELQGHDAARYERMMDNLRESEGRWRLEDEVRAGEEGLGELGFVYARIRYSGFWSQGDGASFNADVHMPTWLRGKDLSRYPELAKYQVLRLLGELGDSVVDFNFKVTQSGRYVHEYTMVVEDDSAVNLRHQLLDDGTVILWGGLSAEGIAKDHAQLRTDILDSARHAAREIYRRLQQTYEYATSDEALWEAADEHGLVFEVEVTTTAQEEHEEARG